MKRLAPFVLVLAACELAPLDVEGLRCDDARPCGPGFECVDAVCVAEGTARPDAGVDGGPSDAGADAGVDAGLDAGADAGVDAGTPDAGTDAGVDAGVDAGIRRGVNLLANPGFENATSDGGVVSWRATTGRVGSSTVSRSGNRSGFVFSTGSMQLPVLTPNADVEGAELGMLFCATVWVRSETDAAVDVILTVRDRFADGGTATSSGTRVTVRSSWVQLREEYASIGNSDVQFRVSSGTRYDAGDGFLVDDAWLSLADTTFCP